MGLLPLVNPFGKENATEKEKLAHLYSEFSSLKQTVLFLSRDKYIGKTYKTIEDGKEFDFVCDGVRIINGSIFLEKQPAYFPLFRCVQK